MAGMQRIPIVSPLVDSKSDKSLRFRVAAEDGRCTVEVYVERGSAVDAPGGRRE